MQLTDSNGNIYGVGGLEITGIDGKPKVPSSAATLIVNSTPITGGTVLDSEEDLVVEFTYEQLRGIMAIMAAEQEKTHFRIQALGRNN